MRSISTIQPYFLLWLSITGSFVEIVTGACTPLTNNLAAPKYAKGFTSQIAVNGLARPRSIVFDKTGHLLVLDAGKGVVRVTLDPTCLTATNKQTIISNPDLNHGLDLSPDGNTLYTSDQGTVYAYDYNAQTGTVSNKRSVVTGMSNGGHSTRTVLASKTKPGTIVVSRGSDGNLDMDTLSVSSGKSQIRMFVVSNTAQDYTTSGVRLGWGLRNSVGLAEDARGGIWSVENSADEIRRSGVDVHESNPAEEMNYHGLVTDNTARGNYGYPMCLGVWNPSVLPNKGNLKTGDQFVQNPNATFNDQTCADRYIPPRTAFDSHNAPLDINFGSQGHAWVTFHGSWDRSNPAGYKLSVINFWNYEPLARRDSQTAAIDIMWNADPSKCPSGGCFKPVGLALDSEKRLFMTSDSTGEIYMVTKTGGGGIEPRSINEPPTDESDQDSSTDESSGSTLQRSSFGIVVVAVMCLIYVI